MRGLQYLFLQSLPHVIAIPDLSRLTALRRIYLENMKGLKDITLLSSAPSLEEFVHVSAEGMEPRDYEKLLKLPTLKNARVGFGSDRKNQAFARMLAAHGIKESGTRSFLFT